jgi:hypothetical protein
MRNDYTHITLVLDRSGSMSSIKDAAEEAFNGYIDAQRQLPGVCTVTVRQFDDQHDVVVDHKPIAECPRITLQPRGSTALLDAVGRGIHATGATLAAIPESERPATVVFVIQTDGLENASVEFTVPMINQMITHQRDVYRWEFVFLGANQDAIATAAKLGIGAQSAATYAANAGGASAAVNSLNRGTATVRMKRMAGNILAKFEFNEQDRKEMQNETT